MTIVDQGSGTSPTNPATFVYSVNQQNLDEGERLEIYCDRGIYMEGVFHVRGGTINKKFDNENDYSSREIYLPPGFYDFGFQCYDLVSQEMMV